MYIYIYQHMLISYTGYIHNSLSMCNGLVHDQHPSWFPDVGFLYENVQIQHEPSDFVD